MIILLVLFLILASNIQKPLNLYMSEQIFKVFDLLGQKEFQLESIRQLLC
jgi:hypothetical protein